MRSKTGYFSRRCKEFRQFVKCFNKHVYIASFILPFIHSVNTLAGMPKNYKNSKKRIPSSNLALDEAIIVPRSTNQNWYESMMVDDDQGVLNSLRNDIRKWQESENYKSQWGMGNTGLFPDQTESQKKRVEKDLLKYADKRLSGEVKKAPKNSSLHTIGKVHESLRPSSTVSMWEGYAIKFQVRVLQGKSQIHLKNPYMTNYLEMTFSGRKEFISEKRFEDIGLRMALNYRLDFDQYYTTVEKKLTETISASVSSTQDRKTGIFTNESDSRFQLNYYRPF